MGRELFSCHHRLILLLFKICTIFIIFNHSIRAIIFDVSKSICTVFFKVRGKR